MKRLITMVTIAAATLVGLVRPAPAAEWLWISAPDWSYSTAQATAPPSFAYFWATGPGFTFASASAVSRFGAATASARASPDVAGGQGVAAAIGFSDPNANLSISDVTPTIDSGTGKVDGLTVNLSQMRDDGSDQFTAYLFTGNPCVALAGGACPPPNVPQSTGGTMPQPVVGLPLGDRLATVLPNPLTDPNFAVPFNMEIPLNDLTNPTGSPQLVLAAFGQAAPEPASILILASGLILTFGLARRRKRR